MELFSTPQFDRAVKKLSKDISFAVKLGLALERWKQAGMPVGDIKPVGEKVHELRLQIGSGYRFTSPKGMGKSSFCCSRETNKVKPET